MALADGVTRTRINEQIKAEASLVLESIGLSMSDAIHLMLTHVVHEKALPFEPLIPNEETLQAIKEARVGIKNHSTTSTI